MSSTISSGETAPLLVAGLGIFGVVAGIVVERLLRFSGRLWCEPADYEVNPRSDNHYEGIKTETETEATEWIDYSVRLDLYNSREVPVGLRNIRLVFKYPGGGIQTVPKDKATEMVEDRGPSRPDRRDYEHAYVINLPPRQWVVKELFGRFDDPEDIRLVFGWQQLEFVGERQRVWPLRPKRFSKVF